jgi:hypothetical protein
MFTAWGSNTRIPWILAAMSNGVTTAWAHVNGSYVAAPPPNGLNVSYITDNHVVAGNRVWFWNGDAYGNRGAPYWFEMQNTVPPDGATIRQIAYAQTAYTRDGAIGPSNLWMVDSQDRIWLYDELPGPVK